MDITICMKGKKLDKDSTAAMAEYMKRMSTFCRVNTKFFKSYTDYPVALGEHSIAFIVSPGKKSPSSPELAETINHLQTSGYSSIFYYVINDEDTLSDEEQLHFSKFEHLHLSCFTMQPHTTAIVLSEQLYRAFTILNHITYHK